MRGLAYGIAAIAAVGIVIGISMTPQPSADENASITQPQVASTRNVIAEAGELVVSVPEMHCEFACFPRVKELIENTDCVQSVELAEQKEEGVIDNRQVIVKHDAGFDAGNALALLEQEGFEGSQVVQ